MSRKPVIFDEAITETKKRFSAMPPALRPSKQQREARPRTDSEKRAIVRAVAQTVRDAAAIGYIVKTEKGYKVTWKQAKE